MALQNLTGNLATEATLASVLAELTGKLEPADLAALATASKQDAQTAVLNALVAELAQKVEPADLATLSTAAKQDAAKNVLDSVNARLASVLSVAGTVTVANPTANPETGLAKDTTVGTRFGGGKTTRAIAISQTGDNVILAPPPDRAIRLLWMGLSTSQDNASEVKAEVKLVGSGGLVTSTTQPTGATVTTGGVTEVTIYRWALGNPGAFSHWEPVQAGPGDSLVIELSAAQEVLVNVTYEETLV